MTMITPSYLGETIEYSSLHACRSTLEDPTANPAAPGSAITLFVNGFGLAGGQPVTGAIAASPPIPLGIPVVASGDAASASAESVPGTVNGVAKVHVILGQGEPQGAQVSLARFSLTIGGVAVRDPLVVWMRVP